MNEIIDRIANIENLFWAWEKVKNFYRSDNIWFNEIEIFRFESNLYNELNKIKSQIENSSYKTKPIKPLGYPKSYNEKGPRTRQAFWIPIRDQVAWVALVNIIGPDLDYQMPFWSYSYRLYSSMFYEEDEKGQKKLKFGWYRNSKGLIYKRWNQSWPLYRRHIGIVTKMMFNQNDFKDDLDDKENETYNQNEIAPQHLKVKYLETTYWTTPLKGEVYWAGIDLDRFYPSVKIDLILNNFNEYFSPNKNSEQLRALLKSLLTFRLDKTDWSTEDLNKIDLNGKDNTFKGIPTGLFVAGFLANLALLKVDNEVNKALEKKRNIVHFRYVDDHVILCDNFNDLINWINWYNHILNDLAGLKINYSKTEPVSLVPLLEKQENLDRVFELKAEQDSELDRNFPTPLMTQTLAKISKIANTDFDLLDEDEEEKFIFDLEHLLLVEFPDQELPKDTRVSFAAGKLSQVVPKKKVDFSEILKCEKELNKLFEEQKKLPPKSDALKENETIELIKDKINNKEKELEKLKTGLDVNERKLIRHTLKLLLKAVKENHDKIRLWQKIIEFCRKVGVGNLQEIFALLKQLKDKDLCTDLSFDYIYSYLLFNISEQLIKCYLILKEKNISFITQRRIKCFLKQLLDEQQINNILNYKKNICYLSHSNCLIRFTLGNILFLLSSDLDFLTKEECSSLIKKCKLFDWEKPLILAESTNYDFIEWSWWFMQRISDKSSSKPHLIWYKIIEQICYKQDLVHNPTALSILALYPLELPGELIELTLKNKVNVLSQMGNGWVYERLASLFNYKDVDSLLNSKVLTSTSSEVAVTRLKKTRLKMASYTTNQITLYEWVTLLHSQNSIPSFDPRLSEWTALEIVHQICEILDNQLRDIFKFKDASYKTFVQEIPVHPANFQVPNSWITIMDSVSQDFTSWEEWRQIIRRDKIKTRKKPYIIDYRYVSEIIGPHNLFDRQLSLIYGIGIILIGLLIGNFSLPSTWNLYGQQRIWSSLLKRRIYERPLSSLTLNIIESCFSSKNRETMFIKDYQSTLDLVEDTLFDPQEIYIIKALISSLKDTQKKLERFQISIQGNEPRQIIPVSIIQLTRKFNVFEDINEVEC